MPRAEPDEQLVRRVAEGDEAALEELYSRYAGPLSHFIHRQTGGQDVEDILQETWLRVIRHAGRFDAGRRFSTWLFQIAINLCRDWNRKQPKTAPLIDQDMPAARDRTDNSLDAGRLLSLLPEAQREVLILRFYHDMTEAQVAAVAGCPKGTVKSRMHKAITRLATLVGSEDR